MKKPENHQAYGERETDTLTAMRQARRGNSFTQALSFDVDAKKLAKGDIVEIGKGLANRTVQEARNTPGFNTVSGVGDVVLDGYQAGQLNASVMSGIEGATGTDEFSEIVNSKRLSFWDKIGEGLSWIGGKISGFFSALIPFGKTLEDTVSTAQSTYQMRKLLSNDVDFDREALQETFHVEDEQIIQGIAADLDQNRDGRVDMLELNSARNLLDADKDGNISQSEIDAHGGLSGALAFIQAHHREAIDEVEYDDGNFARYNLMRTLGDDAAGVIGERFQELDVNNDGTVSRDEYRTALGRLDVDGDHFISASEVEAYRDNPDLAFDVMTGRREASAPSGGLSATLAASSEEISQNDRTEPLPILDMSRGDR